MSENPTADVLAASAKVAHTTTLRPTHRYGGTWGNQLVEAAVYRLDPPMRVDIDGAVTEVEYVIASATISHAGPETLLFPANRLGRVLSEAELPGSFRGKRSHRTALGNAGYVIAGRTAQE